MTMLAATAKTSRLFLSLVALVAGALAAPSPAAAEAKRVGVPKFQGPAEGATRNKVMKQVKSHGFQVVGAQQIAKAAAALKVSLDTNDDYRAVAKKLGISAFVTGEVTKKRATLTVRNGSDGAVAAEASWTGPNPRKLAAAMEKNFWRRLGAAIERGKPPSGAATAVVAEEETASEEGADEPGGAGEEAAEEKPPEREKEREKAPVVAKADEEGDDEKRPPPEEPKRSKRKPSKRDEGEDEGGSGGPLLLEATVSPRFFRRDLGYFQNIYQDVKPYKSQGGAPVMAFAADFYPAALAGGGALSGLGLNLGVEYLLPVVKTVVDNNTYGTYGLTWWGGAKFRLDLGALKPFFTLAYGNQRFQLVPPAGVTTEVLPVVNYQFVRIGGGARFDITREAGVMAHASYLHVLDMGEIGACQTPTRMPTGVGDSCYFPKATAMAMEAGGSIGYRMSSAFELRAGIDIRRYGLSFHQSYADFTASGYNSKVAGGAVDQYLMIWLGATVLLDAGSGGGGDEDEEESPKKSKKKAKPKKTEEEEEPKASTSIEE